MQARPSARDCRQLTPPAARGMCLHYWLAQYVTCMGCRSLNTTLTRDQVSRLYIMDCKTCGANRSVVAIKAGFRAVGRGDRRKARHAGAT